MDTTRFTDRADAGEQLGEKLRSTGIEADIVLAIPRGGLPLGRAVADVLDCPLDVVVAKKIGAPGNPEYALGAVASDGTVWRNSESMWMVGSDSNYFETERKRQQQYARRTVAEYRGDDSQPQIEGNTVVVVDDGVATGSTIRACLLKLQMQNPNRLVLVVPVGPSNTISQLTTLVDDVVCLRTPDDFSAVGQYYERFEQVSDAKAKAFLTPAE